MDLRTTISELDEIISRTESVLNREASTLLALPPSRLRREKHQNRSHVHRRMQMSTVAEESKRSIS